MKKERTNEEKIEIYLNFLDYIVDTGDLEKLIFAHNKQFVSEITYCFLSRLIRKNSPKQNKCAIYCINNFQPYINMENRHIKKSFILFSEGINNYKIKNYLEKYIS